MMKVKPIFLFGMCYLFMGSFCLKMEAPQITVMGVVYCDICSNNSFSTQSFFIPGAEVRIDCKFKEASPRTREQITFSANRTTNKHGVYKLDLPSVDGFKCADATIGSSCQATLIGRTRSLCNIPGYQTTTDEISFKSSMPNSCTYTFNPLSFRPSVKNITICGA